MAKKNVNKLLVRPLAITASVLGLMQGIAWLILSVLSVCCYEKTIEVVVTTILHNNETLYNETSYFQIIYSIFLDSDAGSITNNILINSKEFFIFMLFYVVFSSLWILVSGYVMWAMIHNNWHLIKYLFGGWSTITFLTSIVDIVLTALIATDFQEIENTNLPTEISVSYGIVMSLAARGYILWIINVIFASIMIKFLLDVIKNESNETRMPIIHGFESSDESPPWFNGTPKNLWPTLEPSTPRSHGNYENHGTDKNLWPNLESSTPRTNGDYENHGFERSQSFFPVLSQETREDTYVEPYNSGSFNDEPNNAPNNSFAASIANKVATIGRNKSRSSPLNNIPPPVIPEPDYTPPGSPTGLKSVLRTKSNYQ